MDIDILRVKSVCEEYCDFVKCDSRNCCIDIRVSEQYFRELYSRMDTFQFKCKSIQKIESDDKTEIIASFVPITLTYQELVDFISEMEPDDTFLYGEEDDESDWWKSQK